MPVDQEHEVTKRRLKPRAFRRLLAELATTNVASTLVLPSGRPYRDIASDTGWVVFKSDEDVVAVAPPFPIAMDVEEAGFVADALVAQLDGEHLTAVVLVRLGRFAVGVFRGTDLLSSKTTTRYVGSRHKAGGWSQKRFARIREKQVRELFDKLCETTREKLSPYEKAIERLWLGGDPLVLSGFLERCPWINRLADRTADYRLNVPTPDLAGLKKSIDDALSYRVIRAVPDSRAP
jgi:peptide subunit release factor 1 (eRF1)